MTDTTPDDAAHSRIDPGWAAFLAAEADDHAPPVGLAEWRRPEPGDDPAARPGPPPADGSTALLDLVAAVDHLARGLRPGLTCWDAIEEALRWWLNDHRSRLTGTTDPPEPRWHDPDPLRTTLQALDIALAEPDLPTARAADALHQAIATWAQVHADGYNAGYTWPHPQPRRPWPPTLVPRP